MPRKPHIILLAAALAFSSLPARADIDWSSASWGGYSENFLSYDVNSRLQLQNTFDNHNRVFGNKSGKKTRKKSAKKKNAKNPKAYQYTYSADVSAQTEQAFIQTLLDHAKNTGTLDREAEHKIRRMQEWNFIPTIRDSLIKKGAQKDSTAQAMAFWLVINYGTIRKAQNMQVETRNLIDELETVMSKDKDMLAMTDAEKQYFAETLLWLALVQIVAQEEAGDDQAKLEAAAEQARRNLQSLGVDPDTLRIGKGGLTFN